MSTDDNLFQRRVIEASIRIGLLFLLVIWSFNIVRPFILLVLWGAIIAVAVYPLFEKLQSKLGGRQKLSAALMAFIAVAMLVIPSVKLSGSAIETTQTLAKQMEEGTLRIPPPSDKVQTWPLVGEKLYNAWSLASSNLSGALSKYKDQLTGLAKFVLSAAAGAGAGVLKFVVSILIAAMLLVYAKSGTDLVDKVSERLMGEQLGKKFTGMAGATIRSVAQGVLGVAIIQAVLAAIGMLVIGVPYTGLWTLLILLLAIMQLPTIIILGRGLDIPMPVILLGAIGGMILSGIIGLFVGAVVLAVGYKLFLVWLSEDVVAVKDVPADN
jgi:predicted PurR-regulated permease PerM